jgi:E3 ubiquitin-protein ligase UBR7
MGPNWFEKMEKPEKKPAKEGEEGAKLTTISEGNEDQPDAAQNGAQENAAEEEEDDEVPMPPGFPDEDAFEAFLCYKCVDAHPWIKRYAGTSGFLPAVFLNQAEPALKIEEAVNKDTTIAAVDTTETSEAPSRKRKADDDAEDDTEAKRVKSEAQTEEQAEKPVEQPAEKSAASSAETSSTNGTLPCKLKNFPPAPEGQFSLFLKEGFRDAFCRCSSCFPLLNPHPQLLEEEEVYEPPLSDDGSQNGGNGGGSHGSGSLLERGESALRNVDRVRAIEGVMAYNHLKEKLKPFFQQFADSGETIGAEDIKAYFAKLRGDEQGIQEAGEKAAREGGGDGEGDNRKEQSGY